MLSISRETDGPGNDERSGEDGTDAGGDGGGAGDGGDRGDGGDGGNIIGVGVTSTKIRVSVTRGFHDTSIL
jgi:hypothetical protein